MTLFFVIWCISCLTLSSVCWIQITVVSPQAAVGHQRFSSAMSLENTCPYLLRKANKAKFFSAVFSPYPLPPHLLDDKNVSSVLKTYPQKYKIDIEIMDIAKAS